MKPEAKYYSTTLGNKEVSFETGRIARLAGGSVIIRQGDSMMFAAATMGEARRALISSPDRFLRGTDVCRWQDPGSFFRREVALHRRNTGCRLTDRPLRPLPRGHAQRGAGHLDVVFR